MVFGVIAKRMAHLVVLSCPEWSQTGLDDSRKALIPRLRVFPLDRVQRWLPWPIQTFQ